jgi:hypothetical protein
MIAENRGASAVTWLFASFYLVPALVGLLAFWAIWRLIELVGASLATRRTLFVLVGTLGFAPMVVPAGTIMAALVPHGLLLGMPELGYYFRFSGFVFPSFAITAALFGLLSWWLVRPDVSPPKRNWATFGMPVAVLIVIIGLYSYRFPDRDIAPALTTQGIENAYGQKLDDVIGLLSIDDVERRRAEVTRLESVFESDTAVIQVMLRDTDTTFHYQKGIAPSGWSCSGGDALDQLGLMRCTWEYGTSDRRDVLSYVRRFPHNAEALAVVIQFEYDDILDAITQ